MCTQKGTPGPNTTKVPSTVKELKMQKVRRELKANATAVESSKLAAKFGMPKIGMSVGAGSKKNSKNCKEID